MTKRRMLGYGVSLALLGACGTARSGDEASLPVASAGDAGSGVTAGRPSGGEGGAAAGESGHPDGGDPWDGGDSSGGAPTPPQGGAAGGGAGASPSGGSAGGGTPAGGTVGFALPDGCESDGFIVGEKHCSAPLVCDGERLSIACVEQAPGRLWSCGCTRGDTSADYEIPDVRGAVSCEIAAAACADPSLLDGDESCDRTYGESAQSCSVRDDCTRWHEVNGWRLRTQTSWAGACHACGEPSTAVCCRCNDAPPNPEYDYRLQDIELAQGCEVVSELCQGEPPSPSGEQSCEILRESVGPDIGCEVAVRCGQPVELADGSTLTLSDDSDAICIPIEGQTHCICRDGEFSTNVGLAFAMAAPERETCRLMHEVCRGSEPLELSGAFECLVSRQNVSLDSCSRELDCTQAASVRGLEVTARAVKSVYCNRFIDDEWHCRCNPSTPELVELTAADAESACTLAIEDCAPVPPYL